jgi:hypothetical protein
MFNILGVFYIQTILTALYSLKTKLSLKTTIIFYILLCILLLQLACIDLHLSRNRQLCNEIKAISFTNKLFDRFLYLGKIKGIPYPALSK